jgi:hypothetical protein
MTIFFLNIQEVPRIKNEMKIRIEKTCEILQKKMSVC